MSSSVLYGIDISLLNKKKILFIENKGQLKESHIGADSILFLIRTNGLNIYIRKTSITYLFSSYKIDSTTRYKLPFTESTHRVDMQLLNANSKCKLGECELDNYCENYYLPGHDSLTKVKSFKKITIKNIYENIDWILYTVADKFKYDFVLHPGASAKDIKLCYKYMTALNLTDDNSLSIQTTLGDIIESPPIVYQSSQSTIDSKYELKDNIVTFNVGPYDKSKDLIIDPTVVWGTYYGGDGADWAETVAIGKSGCTYIAGITNSYNDIAYGGFQNNFSGGRNAFVVKFDQYGNRLWATYYGYCDFGENFAQLALDDSENVYLCGNTNGASNIATVGAFRSIFTQATSWDNDAYLVKFNKDGIRQWGTYYGSDLDDQGTSCTVDKSGNVYIAGFTESISGISSGGHQNSFGYGGYDAFLAKFDKLGNRLWATYYGGQGTDEGFATTSDRFNNVYLVGETNSSSNISHNGFKDTASWNDDVFLVKFDSNGVRTWGTYYGDNGQELAGNCAVDSLCNVYLCGSTVSTNNIAYNGFQNLYAGPSNTVGDGFLVKFDSSCVRQWATYYGGSGIDWANACAVDNLGNVYLVGSTQSSSNIASNGVQNLYGGGPGWGDGFITKFTNNGGRLWSSYYGDSGNDDIKSCAADTFGNVYIAGTTGSTSNIAKNGYSNTLNYTRVLDGYLAKITNSNCLHFDSVSTSITISPDTIICKGSPVTFTAVHSNANVGITYVWSKNGYTNNISGKNYNTSALNNLDVISCNMYCNDTCKVSNVVESNSITVTIKTLPSPQVIRHGDTLHTSNLYDSYQWLFNNNIINNAIDSEYYASKIGDYSVVVDSNGCLDTSSIFTVYSLGVDDNSLQQAKIFPNPVKDVLTIMSPQNVNVILFSTDGRIALKEYNVKRIDMSKLQPGVYFMFIINDTSQKVYRYQVTKI